MRSKLFEFVSMFNICAKQLRKDANNRDFVQPPADPRPAAQRPYFEMLD